MGHLVHILHLHTNSSTTSVISQTQSECVNADSKPCCTEAITEDCEEMDDTCQWQCKTTTSTAASNTTSGSSPQSTSVTTTTSPLTSAQPEERFCESGTDMYMKGFAVISKHFNNNKNIFLHFIVWKQREECLCDFAVQELASGHEGEIHSCMCWCHHSR